MIGFYCNFSQVGCKCLLLLIHTTALFSCYSEILLLETFWLENDLKDIQGVVRIFRGGFVLKKICKDGAKRGRFLATTPFNVHFA